MKVKTDGTVKVLDFGLAKAFQPEATDPDVSQSPTLTARATEMGVIMGTAAYMAPEQAKGRPVDRRCDIWAFGCVLFEMLVGRRAFAGEARVVLDDALSGRPAEAGEEVPEAPGAPVPRRWIGVAAGVLLGALLGIADWGAFLEGWQNLE